MRSRILTLASLLSLLLLVALMVLWAWTHNHRISYSFPRFNFLFGSGSITVSHHRAANDAPTARIFEWVIHIKFWQIVLNLSLIAFVFWLVEDLRQF